MTVLLREAIGDRLRHARTTQRRTLREVSRAARVSLGYLSEVERGRKEASSELLASICDALDLPLSDLLGVVAADLRPRAARWPRTAECAPTRRNRPCRVAGWCRPSWVRTWRICGCNRCSATG
jgi:transcriptional regulator with XRE-family HTH domain